MAKEYAFVVPATTGYIEPVTALINSINKYHDNVDIHLLVDGEYNLPKENVTEIRMKDLGNRKKTGKFNRWRYLSTLKESDYKAVCICDADMFLVKNIDKYFRAVAGSNVLFGCSDVSNAFYGANYRERYPVTIDRDFFNSKTVCAVPIIFNPKYHADIFKQAYEWCINNTIRINDTLAVNMAICISEYWNNLIILPAHAWTGIHHNMLKPTMMVLKRHGVLVSEAGEEIYMVHGRWFDEKWVKGLMETMVKYYKGHFHMEEDSKQYNKFVTLSQRAVALILEEYHGFI